MSRGPHPPKELRLGVSNLRGSGLPFVTYSKCHIVQSLWDWFKQRTLNFSNISVKVFVSTRTYKFDLFLDILFISISFRLLDSSHVYVLIFCSDHICVQLYYFMSLCLCSMCICVSLSLCLSVFFFVFLSLCVFL